MEPAKPIKLYIKRLASADGDVFTVVDELGSEKYRVVRERDKGAKKLLVKTADGIAAAKIRRITLPNIYAYSIIANGAAVRALFSVVKGELACYCYGVNWLIGGDLYAKRFLISDVDNTVIAEHKKTFSTCGSCCELTVSNEKNELLCVCVSICVNMFDAVGKYAPAGGMTAG